MVNLFKNRFNVIDMYAGLNNGVSDMSTVNSLFILDHIQSTYNLFEDKKVSVISTPLIYGTDKYYNIQGKGATKPYVELSKISTGNTNAEIQIGHRLFDIKHTTHTTTSQNHICPWTYEKIDKEYGLHLQSLLEYLRNNSKMPMKIKNQLIAKLEWLEKQDAFNIDKKNVVWNKYLMSKFDEIPEQFGIPLIVQMTPSPYIVKSPKKLLEKARISPEVLDDKEKAIKAITGVTVILGKKYNTNANQMSDGIIPLTTSNTQIEEIDS